MGLVALVAERVRALCFVGPVDVEPVLRALGDAKLADRRGAVVAAIGQTFVGAVLRPMTSSEPAMREVELEEALADAKSAVVARLQAIRVGGTLSTFLGFVGAAIAFGWVQSGDHGLLALDPRRVTAMGMNGAALSIALGVGGSSFALGSWVTLRGHARRLIGECERAVERARAL